MSETDWSTRGKTERQSAEKELGEHEESSRKVFEERGERGEHERSAKRANGDRDADVMRVLGIWP